MECLVTGCFDCPLCQEEEAEYFCLHPNSRGKLEVDDSGEDLSYIEWVVTPDWCPMTTEPILIKAKFQVYV